MAFNFSPRIVQQGLVLCLDAANPKSYVSGSLVWNDLTRNQYKASIINNITYDSNKGGSLVFTDSDEYVLSTLSVGYSDWSVGVWIEPIVPFNLGANTYGVYCIYEGLTVGGGSTNFLSITSIGAGLYFDVIPTAYSFDNNPGWHNVVYTYTSGILTVVIDGIISGSLAATNPLSTTKQRRIGNRGGTLAESNFHRYLGKYALFMLYNRALSASEVLQNYNALKGRFGLT